MGFELYRLLCRRRRLWVIVAVLTMFRGMSAYAPIADMMGACRAAAMCQSPTSSRLRTCQQRHLERLRLRDQSTAVAVAGSNETARHVVAKERQGRGEAAFRRP